MFIFCVSLPATRLVLPAFTSVHIIPGVRNARSLVPRNSFDSPIFALCPPAGGGFSAAVALSVACHRRPVTRGVEVNAKEAGRGVRNRPRSGTGIGGGNDERHRNITSTHPRDRAVCVIRCSARTWADIESAVSYCQPVLGPRTRHALHPSGFI